MEPDVHTLTGAYALDALSEIERASFERHLTDCPACSEEVRELSETASRLGGVTAVAPPAELRDRVLAEVSSTRQQGPRQLAANRAKARRWPKMVAAAAALVVIAGLGIQVARSGAAADSAQTHLAAISQVVDAPDAVTHHSTVTGGGTGTVVASKGRGKVAIVMADLAKTPDDRTYQLWVMGPSGARSAGVLTDPSDPVVTDIAGGNAVALTVEPAGGSRQPTSDPVMQQTLA